MIRSSRSAHSARKTALASRRVRRSAELRERLFRAALVLFGKKGYAETTVEDITEAADVGKGTFFNYFPTKEHSEIRTDLPPEEIAQVWRQTIFGTLLFWSLAGDASLTERIEQSLSVLWTGIAFRPSANNVKRHKKAGNQE